MTMSWNNDISRINSLAFTKWKFRTISVIIIQNNTILVTLNTLKINTIGCNNYTSNYCYVLKILLQTCPLEKFIFKINKYHGWALLYEKIACPILFKHLLLPIRNEIAETLIMEANLPGQFWAKSNGTVWQESSISRCSREHFANRFVAG